MHLEEADHKWTVLDTGVNDHQDAFKMHSLKPLAEVAWDAFDHIAFVVQPLIHPLQGDNSKIHC